MYQTTSRVQVLVAPAGLGLAPRLRSGLRVLRALPRPAADCAAGLTQLAALLTASDTSADVHATP